MVVQVYRFALFDEGGSNPRLRWFTPDGRMLERRLDRGEVEDLIARVATGYQHRYRIWPGDHEVHQA